MKGLNPRALHRHFLLRVQGPPPFEFPRAPSKIWRVPPLKYITNSPILGGPLGPQAKFHKGPIGFSGARGLYFRAPEGPEPWGKLCVNCKRMKCSQTSNIRHTLAGNKIVDHSDVVGASPVGTAPTTYSFDLTPGFSGLGRNNCKTRREFLDLVALILEVSWWHKFS